MVFPAARTPQAASSQPRDDHPPRHDWLACPWTPRAIDLSCAIAVAWSVCTLALAPQAFPQSCIDYGDFMHAEGSVALQGACDVTVAGHRAYFLGGAALYVLDVTTPSAPVILGSVTVAEYGETSGVAAAGNYVYVAHLRGLRVVNVSNPASPAIVGTARGGIRAGSHEVAWDRRDMRGALVPSGVYFYRLTAGAYREQKKMVLLPDS